MLSLQVEVIILPTGFVTVPMKPFFSIIIPSLNEEVNLPILLNSLARQTFRDFEVITSDCLSKDNTKINAEKAAKQIPSFTFLSYKSKNVSAARNFGASKATGEFLIFFDADVQASPDFLEGIKRHIDESGLDFLTVWNRPTKESNLTGKVVLALLNSAMTVTQKIKPAANGPCIIMKKNLFKKIKGFDDEIVFGEDYDISQKAHKQKARFAVFPKPYLYVSTRRFEKEGFFLSLYKSGRALLHQLFFGPIRKSIFKYEMGGHYFKED